MKVVQLEHFEQIQDFGLKWNDLVALGKDNHFFMTYEWLTTWWKHFGSRRELMLLALEDEGRILAVAPLMKTEYSFLGLKMRNVEFIGSPQSDYHSFLLTEKSTECVRLLIEHIRELSWDCLELKNVPQDTATAAILVSMTNSPLELEERITDQSHSIDLPRTYEEYLRRIPKKMKKNLRRWQNNLTKQHISALKPYNEIGSVEECMNIFFDLHQQRWQGKGKPGKFSDPALRAFHLDLARVLDEKGWLRLFFLMIDDKPATAEYGFEYGRKMYSYLSGLNPEYLAWDPGNLALASLVELCIREGLEKLDLLRGEHPYKERFSATRCLNKGFFAVRRRLIPTVYNWLSRSKIMVPVSTKLRGYSLTHQERE